jgi:glucosamine--fructose-6-phosphate aminotransferase (isomerizing)
MCGIIGYKGFRNANEVLLKGLKKLEYRGYDSWGFVRKQGKKIEIVKKVGKINASEKAGNLNIFDKVNIGIFEELDRLGLIESFKKLIRYGYRETYKKIRKRKSSKILVLHTRWATHGEVNEQNTHPHFSSNKDIAVVHNGIIENYEKLKNELKEKGYSFQSKTDTEVIPHLIEEYSKDNDFETAVKLALKRLDGTFAIVIFNKDSDKIIAARRASPLVLGIGENEFFVASDIPAFIDYTKNVVFLEDDEIVVIDNNYRISNFETDKQIERKPVKIEWDAEQAQKGNYEHFMLKEIFEQPSAIKETISSRIKNNKVMFEDFNLSDDYLKTINRISIIACGTSWHLGLVGKFIIEALGKIPVEVDYASEFRYRNPIINNKTLVIAISQSGETADTLAAIKEAKSKGAKVLSICNVIGSSIPRESDTTIYTRAGIEIGVASTKAFTSQLSALYLFGVYLAQIKNTWPKDHLIERLEFLKKIPEQIESVLKEDKDIIDCAKEYYKKNNALYLGRGTNYPIALEGALKLKEVSYLHAEGYPAAEMKHGPIALIDNQMPVVVIAIKDESYSKIKGNIEEIKSRGGKIIAIATEGDEEIKNLVDKVLYVPETSGLCYPFLTVIPLQLLAYHIAKFRECDIDKPKNLAKSVTVE